MAEEKPKQERSAKTVSLIHELQSLVEKSPEGVDGVFIERSKTPKSTPGVYFKYTATPTPETQVLFHTDELSPDNLPWADRPINEKDVSEGRVQILEQVSSQ